DRQPGADGTIVRRHQEDFCQALSVPPELKYEEEGGPGVSQVESLIAQVARRPAAERLTLHRMLIFHYLIGNADAHAKNYALLYRTDTPDLAPVYDAVCTAVYPQLNKQLAMQIGGRALPDTIHRKHWLALVRDTKAAQRLLLKEISAMTTAVQREADTLIDSLRGSAAYHPVLKKVRRVIETRARLLQRLN
ncbi:MAG: HipA domain-containing protein, partial [Pseudomonadota bacterium]